VAGESKALGVAHGNGDPFTLLKRRADGFRHPAGRGWCGPQAVNHDEQLAGFGQVESIGKLVESVDDGVDQDTDEAERGEILDHGLVVSRATGGNGKQI